MQLEESKRRDLESKRKFLKSKRRDSWSEHPWEMPKHLLKFSSPSPMHFGKQGAETLYVFGVSDFSLHDYYNCLK